MAEPAAPIPQRRPRVPRRVEVVSVERTAPRWVSVAFRGDDFEGFRIEAPTGHIKIFLPADGENSVPAPAVEDGRVVFPSAAVPPMVRTYTPRRFDPATGTLEAQFLLHGDGPASRWAERAEIGDRLVIVGPGGRFRLEPDARRWWIAGDESAVPAIGTLLEALPADASAEVHVEVASDADRLDLVSAARVEVIWHARRSPDAFGAELLDAAQDADGSSRDSRYWVACEASAMRVIRRHLLEERNLPRSSVVTRGYWRRGQSDYPDHDYGED